MTDLKCFKCESKEGVIEMMGSSGQFGYPVGACVECSDLWMNSTQCGSFYDWYKRKNLVTWRHYVH